MSAVPTKSYGPEILLQTGDRVTINPDSVWLRSKPDVVATYAGVVGEVVAVGPSGYEAQVRFPDGKVWQGVVTAFSRLNPKWALNLKDQCGAQQPTQTGTPHYCGLFANHPGPHQCASCADTDNVTWVDA
jgi:hypothetical protein